MLEAAALITGCIAATGIAVWVAYLVGHMHGAAEARERWLREEGHHG